MMKRFSAFKTSLYPYWCGVLFILVILMFTGINCERVPRKGWMTYRYDIARSGVTEEPISTPLSLKWVFRPFYAPEPAWYEPSEELPRSHFDNAHHVSVAGGRVYFGSTVDNKVYAVSAKTGKVQWTFFTEGPVRCAPTIWKNRVYFGSDDGYVYCLKARNGKLVWKYRASPYDKKVLGNGNMISLWPVRTSVLVDNDIVYFGAGVFPYEGIYIYALNAKNGSVIWKNDTIGDHAHELSYNGISPQGYLIASRDILYVPSGRALPAAFDRKSGEFLYYMAPGSKFGGTWALLQENELIAGVDRSGTPTKGAYDTATGKRKGDKYAWYPGVDLVVTPEDSYIATLDGLIALNRAEFSSAETKVNENNEIKKRLSGLLSDLNKKLSEADSKIRSDLTARIEAITDSINFLDEKTTAIKLSSFKWKYPRKNLCSLILAENVTFAGGEDFVIAVDSGTGKELWNKPVEGKAYGLAVTDGCLYVSTDTGAIYCFTEDKVSEAHEVKTTVNPSPYRKDKKTEVYESAVQKIIKETGIRKGYCLVLGCGDGRLVYELARQTDLQIIGIENNGKKVRRAKTGLDKTELLGPRIRIEKWDISSLPDYFANLVVSDQVLTSGKFEYSGEEILRVLKPCGGVVYFGQPADAKGFDSEKMRAMLQGAGLTDTKTITENGSWVMATRGKLEGAGGWTQIFGNPQNTACSGDRLVKGSLGVLWFGEPGPKRMVERHAKATSPVSINGRLFIQGEEVIMAYDSYNGSLLWEREIPGAVRVRADVDGGNIAVTDDYLYVAADDKCYRLNTVTGEVVHVYEIPPSPDGSQRRWGYISCVGNTLYGSTAMPLKEEYGAVWKNLVDNGKWKKSDEIMPRFRSQYNMLTSSYPVPDENVRQDLQRSGALWTMMADFPLWENYNWAKGALSGNMMTSDTIFAIDVETGKLLWTHNGNKIAHITISVGDGKIFFAESAVTEGQKKRAVAEKMKLMKQGIYKKEDMGADAEEPSYADLDVRVVVGLDAATGKKLWEKPVDLTGCGGDATGTAFHDGMLFLFSNVGCHDAWRHQKGTQKFKRITTLSAKNGDILWSHALNYRTRPVIVGDKIILEPHACEYRTGEIVNRSHPITGKQVRWEFLRPGHTCAINSASSSMLFTRSYSTLIYDLVSDRGVTLFGGIRPGCFINMIPANGVLLMPEASSGCTCSFPLRCSVAFKPRDKTTEQWAVFIQPGEMTPVKHFAINFGAPADMKDDSGTVWFGYPNPETNYGGNHYPNYGVKFDLNETVLENMGYFVSDFRGKQFEGTDKPWLFTSGCVGLTRCEVPVIDDTNEKPSVYTVRLGFTPQPGDRTGQRVFDIHIQGKSVLVNFDILETAGGPNSAVIKEFNDIEVKNALIIDLIPKAQTPSTDQAPLINFIEVVREEGVRVSEVFHPSKSL